MSFMFRQISTLVLFLFLPCFVFASDLSVEASLDYEEATMEDELTLTVNVSGSIRSYEPQMPSIPAFRVIPSGTSSNIQIINGSMTSTKTYRYTLIPQSEGKHKIPPISIEANGRRYQTKEINITIGKNRNIPPQQSPALSGGPLTKPDNYNDDEEEDAQVYLDRMADQERLRDYWVEAFVTNQETYLKEEILYTFRFYTSVKTGSLTLTLPNFDNFIIEEVVEQKKYEKSIKGKRYIVNEKVLSLIPINVGSHKIEPSLLRAEVPDESSPNHFRDSFFAFGRFQMKVKNLRTSSFIINVKALPKPIPVNFTNLVGQFKMETKLLDQEIKADESTTLDILFKGKGNVKDAILPESFKVNGFKVYEDKPQVDVIKTDSGLKGSKSFKRALVPRSGGTKTIPPFSFTYFNPKTQSYEEMKSSSMTLSVLGGQKEELEVVSSEKTTNDQEKTDLSFEEMAAYKRHIDLTPQSRPHFHGPRLIVFILLPFSVVLLVLFASQLRSFSSGSKKQSYKKFIKNVERLQKNTDDSLKTEKFLQEVKTYIGNRFNRKPESLTQVEIIDLLKQQSCDENIVSSFKVMISDLEKAQYGGRYSLSKLSEDDYKIFCKIIEKLDKNLKL